MRSRKTGVMTRRNRITMTANRRQVISNNHVLFITKPTTKMSMLVQVGVGVAIVLVVALVAQIFALQPPTPNPVEPIVLENVTQDEDILAETPMQRATEANAFIDDKNRWIRLSAMQDELAVVLNDIAATEYGMVGISYFCLTTGRHIAVNGDEMFFAASTIKLAAHMLTAEAVHQGWLSWDDLILITEYEMQDAAFSGVLYDRGVGIGHQMTIYDLMRYSIVYSDNIGFTAVLRAALPWADHWSMHFTDAVYRRFMPQDYGLAEARHRITPNHQMNILRELYRGLGVVAGYEIIINYMRNAAHNFRFVTDLTRDFVAHVPGWTYPYNNDSGIFFTEFPYILVVYTKGVNHPDQFLSNIADLVFEMHHQFQ